MTDQQGNERAGAEPEGIKSDAPVEANTADRAPSGPGQPWASPEVMSLGALGAVGLLAFAVVYGMVLDRGAAQPQAAVHQSMGPQTAFQPPVAPGSTQAPQPARQTVSRSEPGPRGERGPPGPPGDPGIRIVRQDCTVPTCSVKCDDDEVMLTAHCGIGRMPAVYPTERTALCRTVNASRVDVVGACVKMSPR